ncbi:hypothetical protein BGCPKDLD_0224 [Methylorubrum suomiense]|uniref:Uncharacterized protein n=1 Tax=Methylorubrum suomiense TaxID=144191 RepID=A0ABQ4UQI7_9HYPH|nr:hypothetical protein BGCPKDLD_0224 [Methylorubrum suomiense]
MPLPMMRAFGASSAHSCASEGETAAKIMPGLAASTPSVSESKGGVCSAVTIGATRWLLALSGRGWRLLLWITSKPPWAIASTIRS